MPVTADTRALGRNRTVRFGHVERSKEWNCASRANGTESKKAKEILVVVRYFSGVDDSCGMSLHVFPQNPRMAARPAREPGAVAIDRPIVQGR